MAHVNESDASASADSTAFQVRAPGFVPRSVASAVPAGWVAPAFTPGAPSFASGDGTVVPASFGAASAR
jgi:hypothetical protein